MKDRYFFMIPSHKRSLLYCYFFTLYYALEWLVDSMKVDFINISLDYSTFDSNEKIYNLKEFNGDSTVSAKAVNEAYKRGTTVFYSSRK